MVTASWPSIADMRRELMEASASRRPRAWMALMSAPETKALSPPPVTISTPAPARRTSCSARWNSSTVSVSRALRACGRSTVRVATRPSKARIRLRKSTRSGPSAVLVHAAPDLLAQPSRLDVLHEQGRGSVLLAQALLQELHHGQAGVEADQVHELERAHGMVQTQLER